MPRSLQEALATFPRADTMTIGVGIMITAVISVGTSITMDEMRIAIAPTRGLSRSTMITASISVGTNTSTKTVANTMAGSSRKQTAGSSMSTKIVEIASIINITTRIEHH